MHHGGGPHKILRGSAAIYDTVDSSLELYDPARWATSSQWRAVLLLYSDGNTRVSKAIVKKQMMVQMRSELIVLVCYRYNQLTPYYVAVNAADWRSWEHEVQAVDDPSRLPPLPNRRRSQ